MMRTSGGPVVVGAASAKVTSRPARPSAEVEASDENEASEGRHEEGCSEGQGMNNDEG